MASRRAPPADFAAIVHAVELRDDVRAAVFQVLTERPARDADAARDPASHDRLTTQRAGA